MISTKANLKNRSFSLFVFIVSLLRNSAISVASVLERGNML